MKALSSLAVPTILAAAALCGLSGKTDAYAAMTRGAAEGLQILLRIFPALVGLLSAIAMLRASGAMDLLSSVFAPFLSALGLPAQVAPLILLRPLSGSGALAIGSELLTTCGPDSYPGRVASVMLGSTETTFYTIAIYFGAAGIHKTRHAIPAALAADFVGFLASALTVRLLFSP